MLLRTRRLILGVLITSHSLTGCYSWKVVAVSPRVFVDSAHVNAILVEENGGHQYVLYAPQVAGDSLIGNVGPVLTARGTAELLPRRIALASVYHVAIRRLDAFRTLLRILVVPAMVGIVFTVWWSRAN